MKQLNSESEGLTETIKSMRREKDRIARMIIRKARTIIPRYEEVCNSLGLSSNSLYGRVALADLLLNVDFSRGLRKILCYLGLYRPNNRQYNHRLKQSAINLAISHYKKMRVKAREIREMLKRIKKQTEGPA